MKKEIILLSLIVTLASCNDIDDTIPVQSEPIESTAIELFYPSNGGTSGSSGEILLGYGYDATGFCDTVSIKEKVYKTLPFDILSFSSSTFQTLVSGLTFDELTANFNKDYSILGSGDILTHHVKSLLKLADNTTTSTHSTDSYTYYAITSLVLSNYFSPSSTNQNYLTDAFKEDVLALTPAEVVSKYGTHVLSKIYYGTKFEVIYRCKLPQNSAASVCEELFYLRMKEFFGGTPGIYRNIDADTKNIQTNEQLIYNSIGSTKKMCGLINTTGYNPDSLRFDLTAVFKDENRAVQFIEIGKDGVYPLYELINDESKKQEVKVYIENYLK